MQGISSDVERQQESVLYVGENCSHGGGPATCDTRPTGNEKLMGPSGVQRFACGNTTPTLFQSP
jgi:hypothetical protein